MFQFQLHQGGRCQPGACQQMEEPSSSRHLEHCQLPDLVHPSLHMLLSAAFDGTWCFSGNSQSSLALHTGERPQANGYTSATGTHTALVHPSHFMPRQTPANERGSWVMYLRHNLHSLWKSVSPRFSDQYCVNRNHVNWQHISVLVISPLTPARLYHYSSSSSTCVDQLDSSINLPKTRSQKTSAEIP